MTITLNIPAPIIIPPQKFRVRYRLVGAPSWTTAADQDNDPFTLDLPAGEYEFEFTLVQADGTICPSKVQRFTVVEIAGEDDPCVGDFEAVVEQDGRGYKMTITYTAAPTLPCGYKLVITPNGAASYDLTYATLPASPFTVAPVPNVAHRVQLFAILCDGLEVPCSDIDVTAATVMCDPATVVAVDIVPVAGYSNLRFTITQSNPYTPAFQLNYAQNDQVLQGVPDPGGNVTLAAGPSTTTLYQPIQPNVSVMPVNGLVTIHYTGTLIDGCGVSHKWDASLDLT